MSDQPKRAVNGQLNSLLYINNRQCKKRPLKVDTIVSSESRCYCSLCSYFVVTRTVVTRTCLSTAVVPACEESPGAPGLGASNGFPKQLRPRTGYGVGTRETTRGHQGETISVLRILGQNAGLTLSVAFCASTHLFVRVLLYRPSSLLDFRLPVAK